MKQSELIQHAIATIAAQRILLGSSVVDTTVAALREQLVKLDVDTFKPPLQRTAQRKQITILFANVSGFSSISRAIPDTNMLDVMNLLWHQLDKAITNQGGTIDKHIGNAVMGLFGVPMAREDDPERAIQAALTMRAALSNFLQELNVQAEDIQTLEEQSLRPERVHLPTLQLRVGINTGPVLLGGVGTGDEYTVIGDAVNVASRLERAAPGGGILISRDTHLLVRGLFETEPLGPVEIRGRTDPVQVFMVLGAKPKREFFTGRGVEGIETRMVGRDQEMELLQQGLKTAVSTGKGKVITIAGEAGVGKTRLMQEFNKWIQAQPLALPTFKGQGDQRLSQQPYSLVRNLLAGHFGIQNSDSSRLAEEKLVQGIQSLTGLPPKDVLARARTIAQLVGLDLAPRPQYLISPTESPQVRNRAYEYLIHLFKYVSANAPATLLILEDVHWADESSLDFLDRLVGLCRQAPLLVYHLTRPSLFEQRTEWGMKENNGVGETAVSQSILHLRPLTNDQSHQLVKDILRKLPETPTELSDLVVERAEGNPFFLEELIKVFIEDGLILVNQEKWQLKATQLDNVRIPTTLTGVLQARLDRLSELERATLQRAAVVGRQFWDSAVIHMNELAEDPLHASETLAALQALEKREMIFKRQTAVFTGTQSYYFKHSMMREVTYEGVLLRDRPIFHKQVADWLAEQSGERIAEYAGLIAEHYELAGENGPSAELYEMAAMRAQDMSNPAKALEFYGRALSLVSEQSYEAAWQLRLQQRIAKLLKMQSRFVEAAQTYMSMRYTAEIDGDLVAQAHAWNGLASIHQEQADYELMLEAASQAEQVAWLVSAENELAQALLTKSKAFLLQGDQVLAAAAANRALSISDGQHEVTAITKTLSQLCQIFIEYGLTDRVFLYLGELADQLELQDLKPENIALNREEQGRILRQLEQFNRAAYELIGALDIYRELDFQQEIAFTLNELGELAHLRGNPAAAIPLFREAIDIANAIGDNYSGLFYRTNYGGALSDTGQFELADGEFKSVITVAEDIAYVVKWKALPKIYRFMAGNQLRQDRLGPALKWAQHALSLLPPHGETREAGEIWRLLGKIASQLSEPDLSIKVMDKEFDAAACFAESLRLLREKARGEFNRREQALTILSWADYETDCGHKQRGEALRAQGEAMAVKLEIELMN